MSEPSSTTGPSGEPERLSMLFAQLVMQQANMALMLLGKINNPQSNETVKDLDAARLFIDELEMLEVKTKGNLSKEESDLLKQSLMNLRLAFVEAVESPAAPAPEKSQTSPGTAPDSASAGASTPQAAEEEHRKKFSKKY